MDSQRLRLCGRAPRPAVISNSAVATAPTGLTCSSRASSSGASRSNAPACSSCDTRRALSACALAAAAMPVSAVSRMEAASICSSQEPCVVKPLSEECDLCPDSDSHCNAFSEATQPDVCEWVWSAKMQCSVQCSCGQRRKESRRRLFVMQRHKHWAQHLLQGGSLMKVGLT